MVSRFATAGRGRARAAAGSRRARGSPGSWRAGGLSPSTSRRARRDRREIANVVGELRVKEVPRVGAGDREQSVALKARALHRRMRFYRRASILLKTLLALVVIGIAAAGLWRVVRRARRSSRPLSARGRDSARRRLPRRPGPARENRASRCGAYEFETLARAWAGCATSRPAATRSRAGDAAAAAGEAHARRRHPGRGAPDRRLDLRAVPRRARCERRTSGTTPRGWTTPRSWRGCRPPEAHPEGLFFPDTYLFAKGSSDLAVLRRAYRAMQRHLRRSGRRATPNALYKTPYEGLIMASIIEKETGQSGERDLIGGVLTNRLRIGMRLQVDPTIIYGLGATFDGNLKRSHLPKTALTTPTRAPACRRRRSRCRAWPRCARRCARRRPTRCTTCRAATAPAISRARWTSTTGPSTSTSAWRK